MKALISREAILKIENAIQEKNQIRVVAYAGVPQTEELIRRIADMILRAKQRADIYMPIAMILKELMVNAVKANFKRVFFEQENLDIKNPADYARGIARFKETLREESIIAYGQACKQRNYSVTLDFEIRDNQLGIRIANSCPMTSTEEFRIQEKLKEALHQDDFGNFLSEAGDDTEGAGLGLLMVILALRSADINPETFTIRTEKNQCTIAHIEFPLNTTDIGNA